MKKLIFSCLLFISCNKQDFSQPDCIEITIINRKSLKDVNWLTSQISAYTEKSILYIKATNKNIIEFHIPTSSPSKGLVVFNDTLFLCQVSQFNLINEIDFGFDTGDYFGSVKWVRYDTRTN